MPKCHAVTQMMIISLASMCISLREAVLIEDDITEAISAYACYIDAALSIHGINDAMMRCEDGVALRCLQHSAMTCLLFLIIHA